MDDAVDHAAVVVNPILICVVAAAASIALAYIVPLSFLSARSARELGVVVFCLGFFFGLPATRAMKKARTTLNPHRRTTALVTTGVFRLSRNPIYIAMLFHYAGLVIFFDSLWGVLALPLVLLALDRWVVAPEEAHLGRVFLDEFPAYRRSVRRWL